MVIVHVLGIGDPSPRSENLALPPPSAQTWDSRLNSVVRREGRGWASPGSVLGARGERNHGVSWLTKKKKRLFEEREGKALP